MDRINANSINPAAFPINHAINAYSKVNGVQPVAAPSRIRQITPVDPIAKIGPTGAAKGTPVGNRVDALVAGQVDPIDLTTDVNTIAAMSPAVQQTSAGTYSMYPVAADRNQAATGIAVGRSLDIQG